MRKMTAIALASATFLSLSTMPAIVQAAESPSEVVVADNHMVVVSPNRKQRLSYRLSFHQPWKEDLPPEITFSLHPAGTSVDSEDAILGRPTLYPSADNQYFNVLIDIPPMEPGDYLIDFGYRRDGKFLQTKQPSYVSTEILNRKPKSLSDDGTILRDEKPFFPIGINATAKDNLKSLADAGFNTVRGDAEADLKALLDAAQKNSLLVNIPLNTGAGELDDAQKKVEEFAEHPAVFSWEIWDEPQGEYDKNVASKVPAAYRALGQIDTVHPLNIVLNQRDNFKFWSNFGDVVRVNRSDDSNASAVIAVASPTRNIRNTTQLWQGVISTIPLSASAEDARNMAYLAIINGAKGIFWDTENDKDAVNNLRLKDINAEIKSIADPVMSGEYVPVQKGGSPIYVAGRKYENKLYIFYANATKRKLHTSLQPAGLPQLKDGNRAKSTFISGNEAVKVDTVNRVVLDVEPMQAGTLIFDIPETKK